MRPQYGSGSQNWAQAAYSDLGKAGAAFGRPLVRACTGAKIGEFFAPQGNHPPQWTPKIGRFELITFTFGGNDVDFADVIAQCVHAPFSKKYPSDPGHHCPAEALLRAKISALRPKYTSFLEQVAQRVLFDNGEILVLGYPDLIEPPSRWPAAKQKAGGCAHLTIADAYELRRLASYLNATLASAAAATQDGRIHFVDVATGGTSGISKNDPNLFEPAHSAQHELCSSRSWINPIKFNLGSPLHDLVNGSYHPNQAGQDAMGAVVAHVILHPPIP